MNIAISSKGAEKAEPILIESQSTFNDELKKLANYSYLTDLKYLQVIKVSNRVVRGDFIDNLKRKHERGNFIVSNKIFKNKEY